MAKTIHVIISGRVQGVSYRAWTESTARKLKISGWVRNRKDRTVEAVFHGDDAQLEHMLKACKKGPMLARVDQITSSDYHEALDLGTFITKPTL